MVGANHSLFHFGILMGTAAQQPDLTIDAESDTVGVKMRRYLPNLALASCLRA